MRIIIMMITMAAMITLKMMPSVGLINRWSVDRILPWLLLFILGKGDLLLLPMSTQQFLKWVPSYRQLKDLVRVLKCIRLRAWVHFLCFLGCWDGAGLNRPAGGINCVKRSEHFVWKMRYYTWVTPKIFQNQENLSAGTQNVRWSLY